MKENFMQTVLKLLTAIEENYTLTITTTGTVSRMVIKRGGQNTRLHNQHWSEFYLQ